jgi:hypothetical protein
MLREHVINLAEAMTKKGSLRNCKSSVVISLIGMMVDKELRMNSFEPMVG